jgi:hypothetical protein
VSDDDRKRAERRKIIERLNSFEGDGLSEEEVKRLEKRERENALRRDNELEKGKRTLVYRSPTYSRTAGNAGRNCLKSRREVPNSGS